jgi:spore coat polysaccharide biosynthesis protein SpsF
LHWPDLGLTLDEPEDYKLLKKMIETLGEKNPIFNCQTSLDWIRKNPEWRQVNQHIARKGDT